MLTRWRTGDDDALDALVPLVYGELRRLARRYLHRERGDQTLETHDHIHEAFFRLIGQRRVSWQNRAHFFAIAACMMRRILVDRARRRRTAKHGGRLRPAELSESLQLPAADDASLLGIDEALLELEAIDPTLSRIVELRFFGGLEYDEVAAVLGVSNPTVRRRWRMARAWLYRRLGEHEPDRAGRK